MEKPDQLCELFRMQKALYKHIGLRNENRTISRWALERKVG